jgi:C1A family cysteine protease
MCGSCWAFSAVGALEGAVAIATGAKEGDIIDLSEEQVLDCDRVDKGCAGGDMETAYGECQCRLYT